MKFLILFALVAVSQGKLLETTIEIADTWKNLGFEGIRPPVYGITRMNQSRIIGGTETTPGEFPYQISLQIWSDNRKRHICGGSILAPNKIATAAHCCYNQSPSRLQVVAGAHNIMEDEASQQIRTVESITIHEEFNTNTINYDGCKLYLETPLELNDRVATISPCETEPSGTCTTTGWGTISVSAPIVPLALQKVDLEIVDRVVCRQIFHRFHPVTDTMICAGGTRGQGGCNGDSGGPLVCGSGCSRCLAGATSWGIHPCAQGGYPTVFSSVTRLRDFYNENT